MARSLVAYTRHAGTHVTSPRAVVRAPVRDDPKFYYPQTPCWLTPFLHSGLLKDLLRAQCYCSRATGGRPGDTLLSHEMRRFSPTV